MRNQSRAMVSKLVVKSGKHLLNWESQEGLHSSLLHSLVGDEMRNMNRPQVYQRSCNETFRKHRTASSSLQLGSRSLVMGDMLVLRRQQSSLSME